ncbi:L-threonylcarbamoyladenylate synthase [Dongshaea marina]|uniref:L-threonylcarbamoyladenylate synthase n=1 Tax=Dongshaea marina TaxID=2047966 RepID=UPI000D3E080B|nr:L-threonylcarbamoyladenylate synthase [Dongshaea marina]
MSTALIEKATEVLCEGGVIAYATEGVFGLGCDPDNQAAVQRVLEIKQRPQSKGLILIASSLEQLKPYADFSKLTPEMLKRIEQSWPGHVTWVIPAQPSTPDWLTGQFDSIAVRVTAHSQVQALCQAFGKPLVSTSANLSGHPSARTTEEVEQELSEMLGYILPGKILSSVGSSRIFDARTGKQLR